MASNEVGKIAYALTSRGVTPGVVVEWSGDRVRVLVESGGRETWLEDRIFWLSEARAPLHAADAAVDAMGAFHDRVSESMEEVDLSALWDLLSGEGGSHQVEDLAEILFPEAGPEHRSAVACVLAEDGTYFKEGRGRSFTPYSREAVDSALKRLEREEQETALLERVAQSLESALGDGPAVDLSHPDRALGSTWLQDLAVDGPDTRNGARGVRVLEKVLGGKMSDPGNQAVYLLTRLGVYEEDEILALHRNHIRFRFPAEVEAEAAILAGMSLTDGELGLRRTLEPTEGHCGPVAVDDPWTTEVDDALMVEDLESGYRVHVLIADPSAGMNLDSLTAVEGMARAATLYLPNGKVHMFPPVLSEDAFSLNEGALRPMLDFACDLTIGGTVSAFRFEPVLARVQRQLSYEESDGLIGVEAGSPDPTTNALKILNDLAVLLRRRREEAGALILAKDDISVRVEEGEIVIRRLPWASPSRRMVAEFMVLACTQVGRFARQNGIPAVYRRQNPPDDPDAASELKPGTRPYFYRMVRSLHRAEITTQPDFHYGMGVVGYTQVTSPLRRFQDFAVQVQLKGFLKDGKAPMDTERILRIFGDLETRGEAVSRTEREARRYFQLKSLKASEGAVEIGEVLATQGSRAVVALDVTGLEVHIPGGGRLNPGAKVMLRILEADPRRDRVSVQLA
ncbi:MAG: RNB domain-containing ribonuclease [Deltaproteobacteria bacterium]|nr:RNB domain-containing ribonuclease [Deltaproteobacteria bacterium]